MIDVQIISEHALLILLGDTIDETTRHRVTACYRYIEKHKPPEIRAIVPAFTSITVHLDRYASYGGRRVDLEEVQRRLALLLTAWERAEAEEAASRVEEALVVDIPVRYGGEEGPDLQEVAEACGLSQEEVIQIHTSVLYPVHMIGFMPGFPYLGGMSPLIATPRRSEPRLRVPAGSVGIGGDQTGIYPLDSPGGWNLIGRTSIRLFDPQQESPVLLKPGDRVRFVEVDRR